MQFSTDFENSERETVSPEKYTILYIKSFNECNIMNVNKTAGIIESEHILLDLCYIYAIYIINITFMVKLRWSKK